MDLGRVHNADKIDFVASVYKALRIPQQCEENCRDFSLTEQVEWKRPMAYRNAKLSQHQLDFLLDFRRFRVSYLCRQLLIQLLIVIIQLVTDAAQRTCVSFMIQKVYELLHCRNIKVRAMWHVSTMVSSYC